jgi:SAM-dependent methyltransferase
MAIDFGNHGFDYTRELCSAIERYTASAVKLDPYAYVYRGMLLRYAVERWLYIQCINSEAIYRHYLARVNGSPLTGLPALNPVESDIVFFLCGQRAIDDHPTRRMGRWLMRMGVRTYNRLRYWRSRIRPVRRPVENCDILIHIVHSKFANYLAPITRELLPGSYAYLITRDVALGEHLERKGFPVVYGMADGLSGQPVYCSYALSEYPDLMYHADVILHSLCLLRPKCVVVVEGNAPTDAIIAEACRVLGITCFCVQHGWSPYVHNGFRNMRYTEMFVWGSRFAEMLRAYNPGQVFRVTGSHALKTTCLMPIRSGVEAISFFLQAPCALLGRGAYEDFVHLIVSVAQAHPHTKIIVREHPGYPLSGELRQDLRKCLNVRFSIPDDESLADVLAISDVAVSVFSTVLLEAMAMNVVPLICSIGALQNYEPAVPAMGAAIEVKSIADARRVIDEIVTEPKRLLTVRESIAKVISEFFSPGHAAKTIAELFQEACKTSGGVTLPLSQSDGAPMYCPVCALAGVAVLRQAYDDRYGCPGLFDLVRCIHCGHIMTSPRPRESDLGSLYSTYYPRKQVNAMSLTSEAARSIKRFARFRRWLTGTDNQGQYMARPGDLVLDVGCGSCLSLLEARALGAEGRGIEADPNVRRIADELGLVVHIGSLSDEPFLGQRFDLVVLNQVIEHVPDPALMLVRLRSLLKRDGRIVLVFPNVGSFWCRLTRDKWINWHVPYHLHHFSRRSFERMAVRLGYRVRSVRTITPNLWTILQLRAWRIQPKPGVPSPIWAQSEFSAQKTQTCAVPLTRPGGVVTMVRAGMRRAILAATMFMIALANRFIDVLGWGDSVMIEIVPSEKS